MQRSGWVLWAGINVFQQSKSSSFVACFVPTLINWLVLLSFVTCSFQSRHGVGILAWIMCASSIDRKDPSGKGGVVGVLGGWVCCKFQVKSQDSSSGFRWSCESHYVHFAAPDWLENPSTTPDSYYKNVNTRIFTNIDEFCHQRRRKKFMTLPTRSLPAAGSGLRSPKNKQRSKNFKSHSNLGSPNPGKRMDFLSVKWTWTSWWWWW